MATNTFLIFIFLLALASRSFEASKTSLEANLENEELFRLKQEVKNMKQVLGDMKQEMATLKATYHNYIQKPDCRYLRHSSSKNRSSRNYDFGDSVVAFFAHLSKDVINPGTFRTIIFDTIVTNIGNAYNHFTGVFTCPVDGTYVLSWTVTGTVGHLKTQLVINGNVFGRMSNDVLEVYHTSSSGSTSILSLSQGDVVTVRTAREAPYIISNGDVWSTFSGFKIM